MRALCLVMFFTSVEALAEGSRVVVRFSNAWTPVVTKGLSARHSVILEKKGTPQALCDVHQARAVLSFTQEKGAAIDVYDCAKGGVQAKVKLPSKAPSKKTKSHAELLKKLEEALDDTTPPMGIALAPVESPPEVPEAVAVEKEEQAALPSASASHRFRVALKTRLFQRRLTYTDDLFKKFVQHAMPLGPSVGVDVSYVPAFLQFNGPVKSVGFRMAYATLLGVRASSTDKSVSLAASGHDFHFDIEANIPFGELMFQPRVGYAQWAFGFEKPPDEIADFTLANVNYPSFRVGTTVSMPLPHQLTLLGEWHYRQPLAAGDFSSLYFPRWTGAGFDAALGSAWRFLQYELRLMLDYSHYAFSFNPKPGDRFVAGGALDQSFGAHLQVAWLWELPKR